MEEILGRQNSENRILVDTVLYHLEYLFMIISPMKRSKTSAAIVERFAVHVQVFVVATVKSKACQHFNEVWFALRLIRFLHVSGPFADWLCSFG